MASDTLRAASSSVGVSAAGRFVVMWAGDTEGVALPLNVGETVEQRLTRIRAQAGGVPAEAQLELRRGGPQGPPVFVEQIHNGDRVFVVSSMFCATACLYSAVPMPRRSRESSTNPFDIYDEGHAVAEFDTEALIVQFDRMDDAFRVLDRIYATFPTLLQEGGTVASPILLHNVEMEDGIVPVPSGLYEGMRISVRELPLSCLQPKTFHLCGYHDCRGGAAGGGGAPNASVLASSSPVATAAGVQSSPATHDPALFVASNSPAALASRGRISLTLEQIVRASFEPVVTQVHSMMGFPPNAHTEILLPSGKPCSWFQLVHADSFLVRVTNYTHVSVQVVAPSGSIGTPLILLLPKLSKQERRRLRRMKKENKSKNGDGEGGRALAPDEAVNVCRHIADRIGIQNGASSIQLVFADDPDVPVLRLNCLRAGDALEAHVAPHAAHEIDSFLRDTRSMTLLERLVVVQFPDTELPEAVAVRDPSLSDPHASSPELPLVVPTHSLPGTPQGPGNNNNNNNNSQDDDDFPTVVWGDNDMACSTQPAGTTEAATPAAPTAPAGVARPNALLPDVNMDDVRTLVSFTGADQAAAIFALHECGSVEAAGIKLLESTPMAEVATPPYAEGAPVLPAVPKPEPACNPMPDSEPAPVAVPPSAPAVPAAPFAGAAATPHDATKSMLQGMGFPAHQIEEALKRTSTVGAAIEFITTYDEQSSNTGSNGSTSLGPSGAAAAAATAPTPASTSLPTAATAATAAPAAATEPQPLMAGTLTQMSAEAVAACVNGAPSQGAADIAIAMTRASPVYAYGTRVRRGPDWKWQDQDKHGIGTIVPRLDKTDATQVIEQPLVARVRWDATRKANVYRVGAEGRHDLQRVSLLRTYESSNARLEVGHGVQPGPNCTYDLPASSIGVVVDVHKEIGAMFVAWPDGVVRAHNQDSTLHELIPFIPRA